MSWIVIQARSTSTRLPNKCMLPLGSFPLVDVVYTRCRKFAPAIVAIPYGDAMRDYLHDKHIPYYEGPENDVLARYYGAAMTYKMNHICRITADCPLIPDELLAYMLAKGENYDFYTNAPCVNGHDIDVMSYRLLEAMAFRAETDREKEHVTIMAKESPNTLKEFSFGHHKSQYPISIFPKLSIDTEEDYERIKEIYEKLFCPHLSISGEK